MGRSPCCDKMGLKRGPWTPEEDYKLISYIRKYGHRNWRALPKFAGLLRCGKSCRLRWTNYLRPDIKRGHFSPEEEEKIIRLHAIMGNRWSTIASHLPGRTDNEIKNVWNTHLKKRLLRMGIDPCAHEPSTNAANMQKWSSNSSFSDMALLRHTTEQENARQDAETPPSQESTEVITSLGLTDVRTPEVTENAHELHRQSTLCIDFHEMDNLLEHALEFPAVETKPEENITFDGYQQNAWNMSFYPNSACISSTSPVESSISTVGTDERSLLSSLNPLPEGHDPCKLFHNYNLVEGESLVVDEGSLFESQTMAETEQENPYQQYESASDAKLQYSASALEDATSPAAAPFCSQISLCPSENVGTLDDPLPSPANAYCTHRLSEQIVGDDGSTATTQLCPHISSDFCAADVLLDLPDDTSIDGILQLDELSEENFWTGLLQRVGHPQPSLYDTLY